MPTWVDPLICYHSNRSPGTNGRSYVILFSEVGIEEVFYGSPTRSLKESFEMLSFRLEYEYNYFPTFIICTVG